MGRQIFKAGAAMIVVLLALSGCGKPQDAPTINISMKEVMEPDAERIWNIASEAYNDVGDGLEPAKISDADWKIVGEASGRMKERAQILADAKKIVVAGPNEPILGSQAVGVKGTYGVAWDAVGAKTVQSRIDAKPDLFKQKMLALLADASAMHQASQTKDAALLYKISSGLDETCDSCHEPFWGTDEPPNPPHR